MALSHLKTRHGKVLCGLFLGSAMALSGPTPAPAHEDHGHDDDHAHSLIAEEAIVNSIENQQPVTGEEKLGAAIPFAELPRRGDARIQRLIAALRSTPLGREMFDYVVEQDTEMQWEVDDDKRVGAFFHGQNLIALDARANDDAIMLTLTHEIRHAWQFRTLDVSEWELSPRDRWSASRLIEADSCAFTAHYVADYHKQTGVKLNAKNSYNRFVIEEYVDKEESKRDYIKDAFEPCFRRVEAYYNDLHVQTVAHYFNQNRVVFNRVENSNSSKKLNNAFGRGFDVPSSVERSVLYKGFFTQSMRKDGGDIIPQIENQDSIAFLDWVNQQTPITRPEDDVEVTRMNTEFYAMRLHLLRGADGRTANTKPSAPEPSPNP